MLCTGFVEALKSCKARLEIHRMKILRCEGRITPSAIEEASGMLERLVVPSLLQGGSRIPWPQSEG